MQELHDAVHVHKWHDAGFLNQYGAYTRIDIPLVIKQNLVGKVGRKDGAGPRGNAGHVGVHVSAFMI